MLLDPHILYASERGAPIQQQPHQSFDIMATLETLGTLEQYKKKDGKTNINPGFKTRNKRAQLTFLDSKGKVITLFDEYDSITCSAAVSDDLRAQKITLGQVLRLPVQLADDSDVPYVNYPQAAPVQIDNNSYKAQDIEEAEAVEIEDFVAL